MRWLDRAYVQRDAFLIYIKGNSSFKNLETDPAACPKTGGRQRLLGVGEDSFTVLPQGQNPPVSPMIRLSA